MRRLFERMPVPTGRLVLAAALLAAVAATLPLPFVTALLALNGALLLVAAVDLVMTPDPRSVVIQRLMPDTLHLGRHATAAWTIENPRSRPLSLSFSDELPASLGAVSRRISLVVPASSVATTDVVLRPKRRGRFVVEALAVRVSGPIGLVARQGTQRRAHTVRVFPSFASRAEAELRINRGRLLEVGLRSAQGLGGGTDFDALRDYTPDDEFRRVDWAATARAGRPIVRTYRAERNQTVLMLLDTGRMMAGRVDDVPRLEHAMDAVMALTTVATRLGDRAGLVAFDAEVNAVVAPSHSRGQLGRVTEAMYELEPRLVESDYSLAFTTAMARFRRRSLLVVLSDLAEQAIEETLLPALPLVTRDHLVVVAGVQDPEVIGWLHRRPDTTEDAYRAAAAAAAMEERRRLVVRLRGLGTTVVDAPPGRLAPALADAYLKVKATGRL